MRFSLEMCADTLTGYSAATIGLFNTTEIEFFCDVIRLLPFELGIRFLSDHLNGDRYFRIEQRGKNFKNGHNVNLNWSRRLNDKSGHCGK
ncbi:hypothetical protein CKO09_10680 [Chromatium weissei]|nr:hypothetical protein [Chromatium weissei]